MELNLFIWPVITWKGMPHFRWIGKTNESYWALSKYADRLKTTQSSRWPVTRYLLALAPALYW